MDACKPCCCRGASPAAASTPHRFACIAPHIAVAQHTIPAMATHDHAMVPRPNKMEADKDSKASTIATTCRGDNRWCAQWPTTCPSKWHVTVVTYTTQSSELTSPRAARFATCARVRT